MNGELGPVCGELALRWTVRLALLLVWLRVLLALRRGGRLTSRVPSTAGCWLWTLGWLAQLGHVALAFHWVHQWSHVEAFRFTAAETARLTGINRGEGIYANYLFTLLWGFDVVRLWVAHGRGRPTGKRTDVGVALFFAFMWFNATVVFGPPLYRWLLLPLAIVTYAAWRVGSKKSAGIQDAGGRPPFGDQTPV